MEFNLVKGFVHVIDDEMKFDPQFGRSILIGLLDLPAEDMHRYTTQSPLPLCTATAWETSMLLKPALTRMTYWCQVLDCCLLMPRTKMQHWLQQVQMQPLLRLTNFPRKRLFVHGFMESYTV